VNIKVPMNSSLMSKRLVSDTPRSKVFIMSECVRSQFKFVWFEI
jgi:hypothetical protein